MARVKRGRAEGSRDEIPFLSGSPVQGAHFGDRDEQTKLLVSRMTSGRNVLVISPRRFGKTSLLLTAAARARRTKGARVGMANLFYCTDRREVAEEVTRAVLNGALGWGGATIGRLRELVRALPGITPRVEAGGVSYSLAVSSPGHSFLEEIRRPIELLRNSAESAHPVCLVLDEFQQIAEMEGLAGVFKGICDDIPEVSLVFSGSHRHLMSVLFEGGGAALKNVAEPLGLDVIPEPEMTAFPAEPVRGVRQAADVGCRESHLRADGRHPALRTAACRGDIRRGRGRGGRSDRPGGLGGRADQAAGAIGPAV